MEDEEQKEELSESASLSGPPESIKSASPEGENPENQEKTEESPPEKRNLLQMLKNKLLSINIVISEQFSFTREVLRPLNLFQSLIGLHSGQTANKILIWHRRIILIYMVVCTIRRGTQLAAYDREKFVSIQEMLFDPAMVLSLTRFLFVLSGTLTLISMERMHNRRKIFLETIDTALDVEEPTVTISQGRKTAKRLVFLTLAICLTGSGAEFLNKYRLIMGGIPWASPLITGSLWFLPFEPILTLLSECSITLVAMDFYMSCTFLRYMIANLEKQMERNFSESPPLVKLHYLDEIQTHHYRLLTAKKQLEDCYSLTVFLYYSFIVPVICFLAYVCYRNSGPTMSLVYGLSIWMSINLVILLILSVPAFQLSEKGDKIAQKALDLYQLSLKGEDDPRVMTKMAILLAQIQGNKITVSAYNYFPLSRGILLTMFSAIFTYFLILVQFGGAQGFRCPNSEIVEILTNSSM